MKAILALRSGDLEHLSPCALVPNYYWRLGEVEESRLKHFGADSGQISEKNSETSFCSLRLFSETSFSRRAMLKRVEFGSCLT